MKKESFTDRGRTQRDATSGTRPVGAVPELAQSSKRGRSLEGETLEPDLKIDLSAQDAIGKLDRLYDEIEAGKTPRKEGRHPEPSRSLTRKDERKLLADFGRSDRAKNSAKKDPLLETARLAKAYEDSAHFLYELARAGYDKEDFLRLAKKEVERIRAEHDPEVNDARVMDELIARFEEERIIGGESEPRTKTVKLDLGVPPETEDDTEENRLP